MTDLAINPSSDVGQSAWSSYFASMPGGQSGTPQPAAALSDYAAMGTMSSDYYVPGADLTNEPQVDPMFASPLPAALSSMVGSTMPTETGTQ